MNLFAKKTFVTLSLISFFFDKIPNTTPFKVSEQFANKYS